MQVNNITPQKQPSFTGLQSMGQKIIGSPKLNKLCNKFEFTGSTMSFTAMLGLLYGATVLPRYIFADDNHDRREILVRDVTSITSILFGAKALSKGFSEICAKASGYALNIKPDNHTAPLKKIWNYLRPRQGVQVLNSEQLVSKYSNIDKFKNGIDDFCRFVTEQGGNLKKLFSKDKTVKGHVSQIVQDVLGKDFAQASSKDIQGAIKTAKANGHKAVDGIVEAFKGVDNKFVKQSKTLNSAFGFLSTILLVPAFMIWIQKFNEKMTKKIVAKELEAKKASQPQPSQQMNVTHSENAKRVFSQFIK